LPSLALFHQGQRRSRRQRSAPRRGQKTNRGARRPERLSPLARHFHHS
jgi:hypothetical protein